jgi:hypothetical protein
MSKVMNAKGRRAQDTGAVPLPPYALVTGAMALGALIGALLAPDGNATEAGWQAGTTATTPTVLVASASESSAR